MCKTVQEELIDNLLFNDAGIISKALEPIKSPYKYSLIKSYIKAMYDGSYPYITIPKKILLYTDIDEFINAIKYKRLYLFIINGEVCYSTYNATETFSHRIFGRFYEFIILIRYAKISKGIVVRIGKTLFIYYKED